MSGSTTQLVKHFMEGTAAARPSAPSLPPNTIVFYYTTDTHHLYVWDQSTLAWITVF